jgi:excisionase family DNA binding protein
MTGPLLVTISEAAQTLRVTPAKVARMVRDRELGSVAVGRRRMIPARELDAYIEAHYLAALNDDQTAGDLIPLIERRAQR